MSSAIRLSPARVALSVALACSLAPAALARQQAPSDLASEIDPMLSAAYPADGPGAAVVVVKDGRVVFRKGYGLANLELGTPMRPDMVFEIGSVTKQFTSTAILMLVEQGKIALDDDIHKYLPEYPDKGAKITVEHLLTHTSGIRSYTGVPKWTTMWRQDLTPQQIIDITKDDPLEFPPGTKSHYNNTGYIMLGAIIEKVSGMSYADFIRKNIFEPLGMKHSLYGSNTALVPNRAYGYTRGKDGGWENIPYLSMTQPYAAGSLMCSPDDLALWDAAVSAGKLISQASWDRAFTSYKLASGEDPHYGYGWEIDAYDGHPIVRHNGGIFGYVSEVARLPKDHVYVVMLTNSDDPPVDTGFLATRIAAAAIGDPYREPAAVALDPKTLDAYAGVYQIDDTTVRTVTRDGDKIFVQRSGRPKVEIFAAGENDFFVKNSFQRFSFERDASGRATAMVSRSPNGEAEVAKRTDKPIPAAPVAIKLAPDVLARYVGEYEIAPGFTLAVTLEGERVMAEATGQPKVEIFARSETEFFLTVVDAQISFVVDASGKVQKLVLHQGGHDTEAPKIK